MNRDDEDDFIVENERTGKTGRQTPLHLGDSSVKNSTNSEKSQFNQSIKDDQTESNKLKRLKISKKFEFIMEMRKINSKVQSMSLYERRSFEKDRYKILKT